MSGMPFSGSDIGGFVWELPPSLELWVRWSQVRLTPRFAGHRRHQPSCDDSWKRSPLPQVGLFSGTMHTQTGGTPILGIPKTHIHDWPEGTRIWRKLAKLRTSL
jgi:hypothetical protein